MKLSDYVALFLRQQGIEHVFVVTGGADAHLIDSLGATAGISYICAQHEQGAAIMADAYARLTGFGAAIGTSGPGATNMLTGALCAYDDSVPVLYITGQVSTNRLRRNQAIRQFGFQEADVVDIFAPVTKHAVLVEDPGRIRYELEKAVHIAKSGRPGPVLLDIPDDVQRADIGDPDVLAPFQYTISPATTKIVLDDAFLGALANATRPVLVLGWGIRVAKAEKEVQRLVDRLGIPFTATWAALDMVSQDHPLYVGTFGTHGSRSGNFAVQNSDFILSIGCRMDTHHTGVPSTFARQATLALVDIEPAEMKKFSRSGRNVDFCIEQDAKVFISSLLDRGILFEDPAGLASWIDRTQVWRRSLVDNVEAFRERDEISPYQIFPLFSEMTKSDAIFFLDTGCTLAWAMQSLKPSGSQRFLSAFNCTPMGYALPASIGGAFARPDAACICFSGDGGLQMNIQELATCVRHGLNIKIVVLDNKGYGMIRQTQDQWLGRRYHASSFTGGLPLVDFYSIAKAYGLKSFEVKSPSLLEQTIMEFMHEQGPSFLTIHIPPECQVVPQLKFGLPLEDQEPHLDRGVFTRSMLIDPLPASMELPEVMCRAELGTNTGDHQQSKHRK